MELKDRILLLSKCDSNIALQLMEIKLCKEDPIYFIETYLYTEKNSKLFSGSDPSDLPFILFDFQKEFIKEVWQSILEGNKPVSERNFNINTSVFIEKSRQMGISWCISAICLYGFLFHKHKYTIISRTSKEVDNAGNMDSIFEKLRYMIKLLPKWMLPEGFNKEPGKDKTNRSMIISDTTTTASITGKAATPGAGRGGTRNAVFMDEMASMQFASQINKSIGSSTACRIYNSTPEGRQNEFYEMRKKAEAGELKRLRYHWSEHPLYDEEWFKQETKGMSDVQIAQEYNIEYDTSIEGRVYPEFKQESEDIEYDVNKKLFVAIDNSHGGADPNAIIVFQIDPKTHWIDVIDSIEINCSPTDMAEIMSCQPKIQLTNAQLDFLDRYRNYNWRRATFISDPYDSNSALNNTTIFKEYQKVGIHLNLPFDTNKESQIMKTRANIYRIRYNNNCIDFATAIVHSRYPKESESRTTARSKPIHDGNSHFRTALEYAICYIIENEVAKTKKKPEIKQTINKVGFRTYEYST